MSEAQRIFFLFQEKGETVIALHADGRVEKSRDLSNDEKAKLFDKLVAGWPALSSWIKPA